MFGLMTFGILMDLLPIDKTTGDLDLRPHQEWLEMVENREKRRQCQDLVVDDDDNDDDHHYDDDSHNSTDSLNEQLDWLRNRG